jgi:predicted alpha/beta hydrolase
LIIAGSGPTDRDGNQPRLNNNSLKLLAEGLSRSGIASLRFDKRGIAKSRMAGLKEEQLRIETYFKDAKR